NAEIPALLPRAVQENALTQDSRVGRRSDIRLVRIEVGESFPAHFESCQRVIDQVLRQEVHNAAGRFADLHETLQLIRSQPMQNDASVRRSALRAGGIERLASTAEERRRAGLDARRSSDFPAFEELLCDEVLRSAEEVAAGSERELIDPVHLEPMTD